MQDIERSQWNNEPEIQLSEDAKEFGGHKKAMIQSVDDRRDVFISYSSSEYAVAERLRGIFKRNGISCWMAPEDIPSGSNYTKEIPAAIRGSQIFVLMLSENAQKSHWVLKELNAAVNEGKLILPFMLENCVLIDEFNFLLSGAQWFPAFQSPVDAMEKLMERVKAVLFDEPVQETPPQPARPMPPRTSPVQRPQAFVYPEDTQTPSVPTQPQKAQKNRRKPTERSLHCPACGGTQLTASRKRGYTASERMLRFWHVLFCVLCPVLLFFLGMTLTNGLLDFNGALIAAVTMAGVALILLLTVGTRRLRERIRRHRVRKHIRVSGVRCCACAKEFVITIADNQRFPWEI